MTSWRAPVKARTALFGALYLATLGGLYWSIEQRGHALYDTRLLTLYQANLGSAALSCQRYLETADTGMLDAADFSRALGRLQHSRTFASRMGDKGESRLVARIVSQLDASRAVIERYQRLLRAGRTGEAESLYRERVVPIANKNLADSLRERLHDQAARGEEYAARVHWWAGATVYLVLACAALTFVLFGFWAERFASYAAADAERLRAAMAAIAAGDFKISIERGEGGLGRLGEDLERMARDLERTQQRLLQSERQSSFGRLASGAAHALNTPVSVIIGYAELLLRRGDLDPRDADILRAIRDQARRCDAIVKNLRPFAGASVIAKRPTSINGILLGLEEALQTALESEHCSLVLELEEGLPTVSANERDLRHVLLNLLLNGIRATRDREGGRVTVRTRREAGWVAMICEDNGEGIPPENLGRIFEAFFTTRPPQEGVGLGLSTAAHIVRDHGGELTAESAGRGRGSRLVMKLPVWEAAPVRSPGAAPVVTGGRVLVVDDEPGFRDLVSRALRREGIDVDTAADANAAIAAATRCQYDVIVTDYEMGEKNGLALFHELERLRPDMARRFIFSSGEIVATELQEKAAALEIPLLLKPYDLDEMVTLVRRRLEAVRGPQPPRPADRPSS